MNDGKENPPDDTYIFRMTDDTGMFQHAKYSVPDPAEGYTTDDNARALIMAVLLFRVTGKQKYLGLISRYLSFLLYAQSGSWFRNFMDYDRHFTESSGSQDCFGRCLWALGFTAAQTCLPSGIRSTAEFLIRQTLPGCKELSFNRSKAYAVIGLYYLQNQQADRMLKKLATDLATAYERNCTPDWKWFENEIVYCNAVLPWSMLAAYQTTSDKHYLTIGNQSLDFLLDTTFSDGKFHPVGCHGWYKKGKEKADFDQQPVEACGTLLACLKAYKLTGEEMYKKKALGCLKWYSGANTLGVSLIDPDTGGCMDGITPRGLNRNEGAESLVSWMIASLSYNEYFKEQRR